MWVGLSALAAIAAGCVFAFLRRTVHSAVAWVWRARMWFERFAFIGLLSVSLLFGGGKTNSPPSLMMPFPPSLQQTAVPEITQEEIAQGWRVESVVTNAAVSYAMPTNGVEYMPWSLRGGYETRFPLDLGDFAFPFGTGVVRRLDVLSGGMVESLPRPSHMSICAAREWASIVPGVGRFWWGEAAGTRDACPYQAKLLTWENVYAGRDCTEQYNAQIELWSDGNFVTRSNNVERVCRRVLPFDLDYDGLPNDIDPAPETPHVPSAWNQSEDWAAAAFPSNAAEIVAAGGYAAWVAVRGADPDRRLVSLGVTFDDGSAWPALLDFGGIPVVTDGGVELAFAIDCGAKIPFSLTAGRLGSVSVTATEPPMRSGEGMTTTESSEFLSNYGYPHERTVGDVTVHLDDPRTGWMCRIAGVSVDDDLTHLHPGDSAVLTAEVSDCHSDAYLGCTWTGGEGITFSDEHSLSTTVTYDSTSTVEWATNGIDLITHFLGYSLTNHLNFTVGVQVEPSLCFSLGCQSVFFLNDAELDSSSNRAERIRPVTLNLTGPVGTNGTVRLSVQGNVNPVLFQVEDGVTNLVTAATEIPLAVTEDFAHTGSCTFYMSCPNLGTGTITATFTPADGGDPLTDSVTFRCIEPLRKLVTTEKAADGRFVNPSRLVLGTNAVLKVGANGDFLPSEVDWRVVSGSAQVLPNGWTATVTPTGSAGDVVEVEARFNDDEIQPRFVLPVVEPRTISVRAFVVEPPGNVDQDIAVETDNMNAAWTNQEICQMLDTSNDIFTQVGIRFELIGAPENIGRTNDWFLQGMEIYTNSAGKVCSTTTVSRQANELFYGREAAWEVSVYFIGAIKLSDAVAFKCRSNVVVGRAASRRSLAHELGHVLGLKDIYYEMIGEHNGLRAKFRLAIRDNPVSLETFKSQTVDWGDETGRGFYERGDTNASIIRRLLMHGIDEVDKVHDVGDIPDGPVYGLSGDIQKGLQDVGATNINY